MNLENIDKLALVFSGGGARGAYQIGVWDALHQRNIDRQIVSVYGTSVGAINGAAFVQGDIGLAKEIWKMLSYEKVFKNVPPRRSILKSRDYLNWIRNAIKEKGINVDPLKKILFESLDEDLIRKSPLDFGLVTYDLTHRRARYLKKSDIPYGRLIDYVIASSTFPVFQAHRIADTDYMDGGIYDNRPLKFLESDDNAKGILCIDVTIARHFWKNKKIARKLETQYIRPSRLLGSPLAFDNKRINRNMKLGYNDAIKWLNT